MLWRQRTSFSLLTVCVLRIGPEVRPSIQTYEPIGAVLTQFVTYDRVGVCRPSVMWVLQSNLKSPSRATSAFTDGATFWSHPPLLEH